MQCLDRGSEACEMAASITCHCCKRQFCQNHTLHLPSTTAGGQRGTASTCRHCTETLVATMVDELDNVRMQLALAFQQADYWSEHLTPERTPAG